MPRTTSQSTALTVVDATKPIDLEKLNPDQIRNNFVFDADTLPERAKAMLQHVENLRTERAQKSILAGLYFAQVKAALGHGEFNAWALKHFAKSKRTVEYYMALAAKFCRSAKLLLPEIVSANQLSLALEAKDANGAAFKRKLEHFVGSQGVTELLQRHGILKQGGKKTPSSSPAAAEPAPKSLSPEAQAYQDCVDAIDDARAILLNDVRWANLTPESAALIDPLMAKLASDFHTRLLQARHEANAA